LILIHFYGLLGFRKLRNDPLKRPHSKIFF
jgi:hypothetical protein